MTKEGLYVNREGIDPQRRILQDHPQVSRDHAEISWTADRLQILDTSKNGNWVNNIRMATGSSKDLSDGDTIRIGNFLFRVVDPKVAEDPGQDYPLTELTMISSLVVIDRSGMLHWWNAQIGRRLSDAWPTHPGTSWRLAADAV